MLARLRTIPAVVLAIALGACAREQAAPSGPVTSAPPAPPPTSAPAADHTEFIGAVDAMAADALRRGPVAGLSIAVFEHGRPVVAKGYGFTDLESGAPATADTSYPIASVTKQFTAALVLRLVDQGRVSLDDPLSRFFPAARGRVGALTLRHLLDHTSGFTRAGPAPRRAAESVLARGGTARDQGVAWSYSNYNFSLLGLVIEHVLGRDYASVVNEEVAVPLALTGTGYCEDGTIVAGRGRDYLAGSRWMSPTTYWTEPRFFAAGGLCSTVLDLVRWEKALEDGRIVSGASLEAMRAPTSLPDSLDVDYGFGTRLGLTGTHRKFGHTGAGQSNKAVVARYPDDDVTIAVLLNTERIDAKVTATGLEDAIARLYFDLVDRPGPDAAAIAGELPRYVGEYREGSGLVKVTTRAGQLAFRPGFHRRSESRLVQAADGVFVTVDDPSLELRFQMRDGQAKGYARYRHGWFSGVGVRRGL